MTGPEPGTAVPVLLDPLTASVPDAVPSAGGDLLRAVPYAALPGYRPLLLDLHRPAGPRPAPVVLFLHGGGWRLGDRTVFCPTWEHWRPGPFDRLVAAGFAVASVDYRLSGEVHFPGQLDDVHGALLWLGQRAEELRIDAGRIVLWGESAGAHLAALAALDPRAAGIVGVVDWYGPADLLHSPGTADPGSREGLLLGAAPAEVPELARAASPVHQVHPGAPPFHIAHGTADRLVPPSQSERLATTLRSAGAPVELDLVPGADHLWRNAAAPEAILERALDFAHRHTALPTK